MSAPTTFYYVRPTDSLFVRGNLAFGEGGEHGVSVAVPPPSAFAGALRSALLGRNAEALARFAARRATGDAELDACLGAPGRPGRFRLAWLSLAGWCAGRVEALVPLPADAACFDHGKRDGLRWCALAPTAWPVGVQSSGELPLRAVLRTASAAKPASGVLLREAGLRAYLRGQPPAPSQMVRQDALMRRDARLGIGLQAAARTAAASQLYTTEGHAFSPPGGPFESTGFLVGVQGMPDGLLPPRGLLRLGGDGRSATWQQVDFEPPRADLAAIGRDKRFRLVLNTPAVFGQGWHPDGVARAADGTLWLRGDGFGARLACAAVGRRETVSGWDLLNWAPKPARAAAPAGSVYWFDRFEGSPDKLAVWAQAGLCAQDAAMPDEPPPDADSGRTPRARSAREDDIARRAEGYNLGWLASWTPGPQRP